MTEQAADKPKVKAIPKGYRTVTPYLRVQGAARLMEFLTKAFNAKEVYKHEGPGGTIGHAEMKVGNSMVMLGEATEQQQPLQMSLYLYVRNCDRFYKKALKAGATSLREPADQFYGDRSGGVRDIWGNEWWLGTHIEDVSPEEIQRRLAAMKK